MKVRDLTLDLGYGDARVPPDVKIYLGPTGPKMMQLSGEVADGERPHRIAEVDHHLVDLLRQAAFLQQDDHLAVERRTAAVGDEAVAVAAGHRHLADRLAQGHR